MRVTAITPQTRNPDRVNIMIDGKYRFSLDIFQISDLGIRVGAEYTEQELETLERESQFGKVYARALEYSLVRPRSGRELRDYLYRKTRDQRTSMGTIRKGVPKEVTERVFARLQEKGYIDDVRFTRFWVESRNLRKGISLKKLRAELLQKGVAPGVIDEVIENSDRSEKSELEKVIAKKRARYPDELKFIQYLARLGFNYEDIKAALAREDNE